MSVSADLVRELRTRGVNAEILLDAVLAAEEERLAKGRARAAKYRNNKGHRHVTNVTNVTPPSPETKAPTPPLKTQSLSPKEPPSIEGGKKNPKTRSRIVPDWAPNEANLEYAGKLGLLQTDIRRETEKFRDHHLKTGTAFFDWDAAWRTWCQRVHEFAPKPPPNGTGPPRKLRGSAALSELASRPISEVFGNTFDEPSVNPNGNFAARNGR